MDHLRKYDDICNPATPVKIWTDMKPTGLLPQLSKFSIQQKSGDAQPSIPDGTRSLTASLRYLIQRDYTILETKITV